MEGGSCRGDLHGNIVRQSSLRASGSMKSALSGRSTPRNSPSFRRTHSSRTPRKDARSSVGSSQWFRSNRLVYWLILITLWAYLGFYVQSKWAHGDNKEDLFTFGSNSRTGASNSDQNRRRDLMASDDSLDLKNETAKNQWEDSQKRKNPKSLDVVLTKKRNSASTQKKAPSKRKKRSGQSMRSKTRSKQKAKMVDERKDMEVQEEEIPKRNTSYGLLVGPFGSTEDRILEWSPDKRSGTCDRKGEFARLVWSRKFVLIFHELSMTGAPLSMMELATELLSCGASVSAVILSKKGGLMTELGRRRIKVIEDRAELSFKVSMKADLIIAGSAVCASWIEQYIAHFTAGSSQIVWWIMENRREYFDRTKLVLNRVKMLVFLSESQSKQWIAWCKEENIKLNSQHALVPLSVNDELAFVAGIPCSLNTPLFSTDRMLEKRNLLRNSVRKEMGLTDNDMLVMSLSSINPGKGQLLLLESTRLVVEQGPSQHDSKDYHLSQIGQDDSNLVGGHHSRSLLQNVIRSGETPTESGLPDESSIGLKSHKRKSSALFNRVTAIDDDDAIYHRSQRNRRILSVNGGMQEQVLKVVIGSVGSKSNKVSYVKGLLRFLSNHSNLSKSVLWTPSTTRVASLYSAADVYIINSQGLGETFGRVTIEAMAFGLPVLGTDAGGTKEIIEHNVTGILHPPGRTGTEVLAENIRFLLRNQSARQQMGKRGRRKVEKMYLKRHMYKRLAEVFFKCMRIK